MSVSDVDLVQAVNFLNETIERSAISIVEALDRLAPGATPSTKVCEFCGDDAHVGCCDRCWNDYSKRKPETSATPGEPGSA